VTSEPPLWGIRRLVHGGYWFLGKAKIEFPKISPAWNYRRWNGPGYKARDNP